MPTASAGFEQGRQALTNVGPTLNVHIGYDVAYRPEGLRTPSLRGQSLPALVDTGAFSSCIDSALAAELELPVIDEMEIAGVQGASTVSMHLAQIYVPTLEGTVYGRFAGVHLSAGGQPHVALLGRTFLQHFTMTYEGRTGRVTINNDELTAGQRGSGAA